MKRQRGRNRRNNNQNANRSMESNGPDVKVRGSAKQIFDKYEALARDAAASGNRVKAENLRQHAEHYLRIVNAIELAKQAAREEQEADSDDASDDDEDENENKASEIRKGRRYPPRARRKDENSNSDAEADADSNDEAGSSSDEKPSTRRRKAPARKPVEAGESAEIVSEAAE